MRHRVDYSSKAIFHSPPRELLTLVLPVAVMLLMAGSAVRAEVIRSFDSVVRLTPDAMLDVTETIEMDFESAPHHGLLRQIPTDYTRVGNTYSIKLRVLSVTDEDNQSVPYRSSGWGGSETLKIGDAGHTVTGVHTYVIHYQVRRAVNFFDAGPELYWDATGEQWPFAIRQATVHFIPPGTVDTAGVRTACYVGPPGSKEPGRVRAEQKEILYRSRNLQPGEGLTIVAGLHPGEINRPGALVGLWWWLTDWWPALLLPLATLGGLYALWSQTGRDPAGGNAVAVEWSPPRGLSPAEVGTLIDESCDTPDVTSTLIDLAARGFLTIKPLKTDSLLFMSKRDYKFMKNPPPPGGKLSAHERKFMYALFPGSTSKSFLSELTGQFGRNMPGIRDAIYGALVDQNFFATRPDSVRKMYYGWGLALLVIGVVATFVGVASGHAAWGIGLTLAAGVVLAFARAMPVKTIEGVRAALECRGFQKFLALVEKPRLAKMVKDDPTIFGRLLPYAMVLGVADRWAHAFDGLNVPAPDWYAGNSDYDTFNTVWFVHDLGRGMHSMSSGFTASAPSTSGIGWNSGGGGGGFSGFGGGGSSGGGFGGGGGGSW